MFKEGSLLLINITGKVKDTGELIETTLEEEAKKFNLYDPTRKYEPKLVILGEGLLLKVIEDKIKEAEIGSKFQIEIPPEQAFGLRDSNKIKLIPLRKFGDQAKDLSIGSRVEVDNKVGTVKYIGSGRVQVDFNHPLAGKTLSYEVEIVKEITEDNEKIKALIRRRLPLENIQFELKEELRIIIPEEAFLLEGLQIIKRAIANDIFKYLPNIKKVSFIESFEASPKS
ncbi:FKBP-type peptidyl-prolyl cis-trans isomerase SlyD [archaeon HR06]|nr:FKBP-type peptidyl-prolyl cis-trans isomerase SlyD [archaeon HR06]